MAAKKRGRHAKKGGRTTPKGTRPLQLVPTDPRPREPGMMEMVAHALRQPHPLDLLGLVSSMVWLASPTTPGRPADLPTVDFLVHTWDEVERPETTALLRAVAVLGATCSGSSTAPPAAGLIPRCGSPHDASPPGWRAGRWPSSRTNRTGRCRRPCWSGSWRVATAASDLAGRG